MVSMSRKVTKSQYKLNCIMDGITVMVTIISPISIFKESNSCFRYFDPLMFYIFNYVIKILYS